MVETFLFTPYNDGTDKEVVSMLAENLALLRNIRGMTQEEVAEVIADHQNLIDAIERCDLAAFEPLVERHLYGGIRRLGSKLTEEYADYFE